MGPLIYIILYLLNRIFRLNPSKGGAKLLLEEIFNYIIYNLFLVNMFGHSLSCLTFVHVTILFDTSISYPHSNSYNSMIRLFEII